MPRAGVLTMRSKARSSSGWSIDAQIGDRVADLLALVEARAADHAVGQAEGDEALLEFAGLEAGAHQDRDLAERGSAALQRLDLLADEARLLLAVPDAAHADLVAAVALGPQRLAEPALVVGDQARRRRPGYAAVER